MSAITDILLTHHLTLNADDETGGWHATCSCGADLGCCEDTREGQKIQAAHVAHLIDPDDREYTPGQRREADRAMAAMSGLIDHVAIPAEDIRLADGTALIENGAINTALLPNRPYPSVSVTQDPTLRLSATREHLVNRDDDGKVRDDVAHVVPTLQSLEYGLDGQLVLRGELKSRLNLSGVTDSDDSAVGVEVEGNVAHDDSSTGDGPAATEHTDSVEATARRGDDSGSGGHGGLWSAAARLFGRGEQR